MAEDWMEVNEGKGRMSLRKFTSGEKSDPPKGYDTGFNVQQHSTMQHPTQHNLSPVEGDHETYADIHAKKADWHYKRAGRGNPVASYAKAGVSDFKSRVARNWPGDK